MISFLFAVSFASIAESQSPVAPTAAQWSGRLVADAGSIPNAFSTKCASAGSVAGVGVGMSLLLHPRSFVGLEFDTHVQSPLIAVGCGGAPAVSLVAPGIYEERYGVNFGPDSPHPPLWTSVLHVAVQSPASAPLMRASIGGGVVWNRRPVPLGSVALGIGTRGAGARFYAELEQYVSRANATEQRRRFAMDSSGRQTELGTTAFPFVFHPTWTTLHVGVEVPLSN
jgi:hypothetical protein